MPLFRSCGSPDIAVSICAQVFQLGGSGEPLGASWGFFGASWILRASWRPLGLLGSPGRLLGPSWRPSLKKEGGFFLAPPPVGAFKWASWGSLGALLGRCWGSLGSLGALLGSSWRPSIKRGGVLNVCPPSGAIKIAFGGALGALLGRSWALLGPSWGPPGPLLGPSWAILEPS